MPHSESDDDFLSDEFRRLTQEHKNSLVITIERAVLKQWEQQVRKLEQSILDLAQKVRVYEVLETQRIAEIDRLRRFAKRWMRGD